MNLDMVKCRKCGVILSKDIIQYNFDFDSVEMKIVCPVCKNKYKGDGLDDYDCDFDEVIL